MLSSTKKFQPCMEVTRQKFSKLAFDHNSPDPFHFSIGGRSSERRSINFLKEALSSVLACRPDLEVVMLALDSSFKSTPVDPLETPTVFVFALLSPSEPDFDAIPTLVASEVDCKPVRRLTSSGRPSDAMLALSDDAKEDMCAKSLFLGRIS